MLLFSRTQKKLSIFVVVALFLLAACLASIRPLFPVVVSGRSMEPTYQPHQLVWATREWLYISRGDVVVVSVPNDGAVIKRVAYVGGDRFYYRIGSDGIVLITSNDFVMMSMAGDEVHEYDVPYGEIFVLGDNINNSIDSRHYGCFNLNQVIGKVL